MPVSFTSIDVRTLTLIVMVQVKELLTKSLQSSCGISTKLGHIERRHLQNTWTFGHFSQFFEIISQNICLEHIFPTFASPSQPASLGTQGKPVPTNSWLQRPSGVRNWTWRRVFHQPTTLPSDVGKNQSQRGPEKII